MPYLVRVGHISTNKYGLGCRGYHVYRRGTTVHVIWGPMDIIRSRVVQFEWARTTMHKDYPHRTVAAACERLNEIIASRMRGGYHRLTSGERIVRRARSAASTRRP